MTQGNIDFSFWLNFVSVVVVPTIAAVSGWVWFSFRTLEKKLGDTQKELTAHKLWAASNYVNHAHLEAMRKDLVSHFERLERNVREDIQLIRNHPGE